jgi:hypothetical protein
LLEQRAEQSETCPNLLDRTPRRRLSLRAA